MEPTEDRVSVYGGDYRPEDTPRTRPSAGVCSFNTSSVRPHINRLFQPDRIGGVGGPMLTRWSNRVIFASRCVTRTAGIGTYPSPLSGMPVPGWKCTFYSVWVRSV
jgi:hypothetical protein